MRQNKKGIFNHWVIKLLSFVVALCVVIAVRFLNVTDRNVAIPLNVKLDSSLYIPESLVPETIEVVISGDDSVIYLVDPSLINATVDFTDIDGIGVQKRLVYLDYEEDIFKDSGLNIRCKPESIKIFFKEKDD